MSDNNDNNAPPSPADDLTPEEIAEASAIRPLEALPSPWQVEGNPRLPEPSITALSPEHRKAVLDRAGPGADADAINGALVDFLKARSAEFRIRAGGGEGITETERAALSQTNQLRLLGEEIARIDAELSEVVEHRTEIDESGNPIAVPVYRLKGDGRTGRENRRAEALHEMALVAGVQGEAELERAAREEALKRRQLAAQLEEANEIKRRAHEKAREDRINAAAATRAKFL